MKEDDKKIEKNSLVPVKRDPSVSVGKLLYADNPSYFKENEDEGSSDGFNERLRDLDVEMQEQAQNQSLEQEEQEYAISDDEQGYQRDKELGFDPLTHQVETQKEIQKSQEHEEDIDLDLPGAKTRGHKKAKSSFLNKLKLKTIGLAIKKSLEASLQATNSVLEKISTYRHYAINTDGNQAGIFDNTKEENRADAKEAIMQAAAARHFLGEGLEALQHAQEAAAMATQKAATPYMEQMEQAKEAIEAACKIKDSLQTTRDIMNQGVSNSSLGTLEHDATLGMNIAGKGEPTRGM